MQKVQNAVLVDAMHLAYRNFHVFKKDSVEYKWVEQFFVSLVSIEKRHPRHTIMLLWDSKISTMRFKINTEYKQNRKDRDPEEKERFNDGLEKVKLILKHQNYWNIEADGYEADDVAAYMCNRLGKVPSESIILWTDDLDWAQLINDSKGVTLYRPSKRQTLDESEFFNAYEFPPRSLPVFKSLTGDKSDNIKGINRFPRKIAKDLCRKCCTVEEFYYNRPVLADVPMKWVEAIKDFAIDLRTNYRLAILYPNIDKVRIWKGNFDKQQLVELHKQFGLGGNVDHKTPLQKYREMVRKRGN